MSKLLNDLLDVSRLTHNKIVFDKKVIDLRDIVKDVFETLQLNQPPQQLEFNLIDSAEPLLVQGDSDRIRQAVANLIENAIKYTPVGGSVTVELGLHDNDAVVSIRDTGKGIRASDIDKIFELFFQESDLNDRASGDSGGGLGIGLFLAKQILEEHGGTIQASSDGPGLGSQFVISVPLTAKRSISQLAH